MNKRTTIVKYCSRASVVDSDWYLLTESQDRAAVLDASCCPPPAPLLLWTLTFRPYKRVFSWNLSSVHLSQVCQPSFAYVFIAVTSLNRFATSWMELQHRPEGICETVPYTSNMKFKKNRFSFNSITQKRTYVWHPYRHNQYLK